MRVTGLNKNYSGFFETEDEPYKTAKKKKYSGVQCKIVFMYRRPILCTLYGAVDFLNVLKKGCWWGGDVTGT
jgi:hypothetical protein